MIAEEFEIWNWLRQVQVCYKLNKYVLQQKQS